MFAHTFSMLALCATTLSFTSAPEGFLSAAPGGPPAIAVAGKAGGDITLAQWRTSDQVQLRGCMPEVRIVRLRLHIDGAKVPLETKGDRLTEPMRRAVEALPKGTAFSLVADVVDGAGKPTKVPEARYVWQG